MTMPLLAHHQENDPRWVPAWTHGSGLDLRASAARYRPLYGPLLAAIGISLASH